MKLLIEWKAKKKKKKKKKKNKKKKTKQNVICNEIGYDFRKIHKEQNKFILRSDKTIE